MAATNSEEALRARLDDLRAWLAQHPGARPSAYIDRGERERSLAYFLSRTRRADTAGRANPMLTEALDELLPGWRTTRKSPEHWDARLAVAHEQQNATTRVPPRFPDFGSKEPPVASIAAWALASWRGSEYGYAEDPTRRARLTQVRGWTEPGRRTGRHVDLDLVRRYALECADFHAQHGRAPSQTGPEAGEPKLGHWLSEQRKNAKKGSSRWTAEREAVLSDAYPAWRGAADRYDWTGTLADVATYRRQHGGLPPRDRSRLGRWVGKRRYELRTGARNLTPDRVAQLDAHLPGWRDDIEEAA